MISFSRAAVAQAAAALVAAGVRLAPAARPAVAEAQVAGEVPVVVARVERVVRVVQREQAAVLVAVVQVAVPVRVARAAQPVAAGLAVRVEWPVQAAAVVPVE